MKLQLNLELGEVAWAVRDRLTGTVPVACLCYKKGHELCTCGQLGAVYFQKVPVDAPTPEELADFEPREKKNCC